MKVLAIGAHPDDLEIGCAGTLMKYVKNGHEVQMLVVTGGECGGEPAVRRQEQESSAKLLGVKEVAWGGYPDCGLPVARALIQDIEEVVRKVEPTFIFAPYHDDTHQDHRHLSLCTVSATRYTPNVLFYECPTTQNFTPSVFVDITSEMDGKVAALKAHASQVDKTRIEGLDIVTIAQSNAHFRGIQCRTKRAEGFMPLRLLINISGSAFL